jgi:hypothetical protein
VINPWDALFLGIFRERGKERDKVLKIEETQFYADGGGEGGIHIKIIRHVTKLKVAVTE